MKNQRMHTAGTNYPAKTTQKEETTAAVLP